jgi:hypothetical protein
VTTAANSRLKRSESLTKAEKGGETTLANTKLRRSESLSKAERTEACPRFACRRRVLLVGRRLQRNRGCLRAVLIGFNAHA